MIKPPTDDMAEPTKIKISVQREPFDVAAESSALSEGLSDVGAIVTFVGVCRDEGGRLDALELEHYPEMAESELDRIAREASSRWNVQAIAVIHRTGRILPKEDIVVTIAVAAHRGDAFHASEFIMDFLKTQAPFWKKEHAAGSSEAKWVEAKATDDEAARRWQAED